MNQFFKSLIVAFVFMTATVVSQAQENFAYVNTTDLITSMGDYKVAEEQMKTYAGQKEAELSRQLQDYEAAVQTIQVQIDQGTITEAQKQQEGQRIAQMEQSIQNFRIQAEAEVSRKQEEYLAPLRDKALTAIKAVAAENGYTYVFDLSTGVLLTYPTEDDITSLVQAKLP